MSKTRKEKGSASPEQPVEVVEVDVFDADSPGAQADSGPASVDESPPAEVVKESPGVSEDAAALQPGPREACGEHPLTARIEALLTSTDRPLTDARLGALLGLPGKGVAKCVRETVEALNEDYESTGRAFRIEHLAGGWQILTLPRFGELLHRLHQDRQQSRLSQAALETLAIVAYRQPIIRAEVEAVRGVSCGEVLRGLLDRRLLKIVGRAEEIGRPMLYGTTREFLKVFGISNLDDLPEVEGLEDGSERASRRKRAQAAAKQTAESEKGPAREPADREIEENSPEEPVGGAGEVRDQNSADQPASEEDSEQEGV